MTPFPPSNCSNKVQELQLPNQKCEKSPSFLHPCRSPPGTAAPGWQEAAQGGAHIPSHPPLLKPSRASPSASAVLLLLPSPAVHTEIPASGLQLDFSSASSSSIQPHRPSPSSHPPAAGHSQSWRPRNHPNPLIQLESQDLGFRMLKLLFNSSPNLHKAPAWQRDGALISQILGEKAHLLLFILIHTSCSSNPSLWKGYLGNSQTFRDTNIAWSMTASQTVHDK